MKSAVAGKYAAVLFSAMLPIVAMVMDNTGGWKRGENKNNYGHDRSRNGWEKEKHST